MNKARRNGWSIKTKLHFANWKKVNAISNAIRWVTNQNVSYIWEEPNQSGMEQCSLVDVVQEVQDLCLQVITSLSVEIGWHWSTIRWDWCCTVLSMVVVFLSEESLQAADKHINVWVGRSNEVFNLLFPSFNGIAGSILVMQHSVVDGPLHRREQA